MRNDFSIPVSAHVKKWAKGELFNNECPPYKVEQDSLLGRHIAAVLNDSRREDFINQTIELTESLPIILSHSLTARVTVKKIKMINVYLEKQFKQSLFTWVIALQTSAIRPYNAVQLFLDHYKITESEYQHASAYKSWQRWKNARSSELKKKNSNPQEFQKQNNLKK